MSDKMLRANLWRRRDSLCSIQEYMTRNDHLTVAELMARIAVLQAENQKLAQRIFKLEEALALARLDRFAPRSEKRADRVFNEAEQIIVESETDDGDIDIVDLPDTGLPVLETRQGKKR